jgi:hypothetical protein
LQLFFAIPRYIFLTCAHFLGPIRSRAKKTSYMRRSGLDYLKEKNLKEMELEEKRLKIEERKVAVTERNIALAEKKFVFESEQYKKIFDSQQEVINKLLKSNMFY